jgi:hypothetical protein
LDSLSDGQSDSNQELFTQRKKEACSAELSVMFAATGFEFCDYGLYEVLKAEEMEKTWVLYEQGGIIADARTTLGVQTFNAQVLFFGVASALGNEIPIHYLKKHSS